MSIYDCKAVTTDSIEIDADAVPDIRYRMMARAALNAMKQAFADPVVKEAFEKWQAEQAARGITDT